MHTGLKCHSALPLAESLSCLDAQTQVDGHHVGGKQGRDPACLQAAKSCYSQALILVGGILVVESNEET